MPPQSRLIFSYSEILLFTTIIPRSSISTWLNITRKTFFTCLLFAEKVSFLTSSNFISPMFKLKHINPCCVKFYLLSQWPNTIMLVLVILALANHTTTPWCPNIFILWWQLLLLSRHGNIRKPVNHLEKQH